MWRVPELNEEYVERMENVLDLYEKPYDSKEPVVCLDEKPIQLLAETREPRPAKPGRQKRVDYEYARKGTANVFCAVEPKTGRHLPRATRRRKGRDFALMLEEISDAYPDARTIHLVVDNLSTHKEKSATDTFGENWGKALWSRFKVHDTPKHASWLNQAEIAISMFSRGCLGKNRIGSFADLALGTKAWRRTVANRPVKIEWKFTKEKAQTKFKYKNSNGKLKWERH